MHITMCFIFQLRAMCEKLQSELDARAKIEITTANENSQTWSGNSGSVTPV